MFNSVFQIGRRYVFDASQGWDYTTEDVVIAAQHGYLTVLRNLNVAQKLIRLAFTR
jgi:hypothetical protein